MKDSQPEQSANVASDDAGAETLPAADEHASGSVVAVDGAPADSVESWLAAVASAPVIQLGPSVGEVIGGEYRIEQRLGEGSMGVVYLAHHLALERRVAIKLHRTAAGRAAEKLLREAQTVAKVEHDNVLVVHGVGTWKDHVFVAMEYVDGCNARQWVAQKTRTWREIVALYVEAGRGLAAAHAAGVVHRDFKPDNVLVARDPAHPDSLGRVRVADFGLAVRVEHEVTGDDVPVVSRIASAPQMSGLVGSPAYMAPEQYGRGTVDARADQFAFCVALWEALVGRRPFEGDDLRELAVAIVSGKLREPVPADLPAHVRKVLRRGLSRDREDRYPDMDALVAELAHDPTVARRRLALVGLAIGATAVATWAVARAPDPMNDCAEAPAIASWWTPAQRDALRAALVSSGRPFAEDAYARVDAELTERVGDATDVLVATCEATHRTGTQSIAQLDSTRECLTQRGREMSALLEVLGRADPEITDRAVLAASSLTPIARCSLRTGDDDLRDVDAVERPRVDAALELIARVNGLHGAGRFEEAIEVATTGRAQVEALGRPRLLAQLLLALGASLVSARQHERSSEVLREASVAAVRSGNDLVAAEVASQAVFVDGYVLVSAEMTAHWSGLAFAWIERAGSPPDVLRQLIGHRGLALRAADQLPASLVEQSLALALVERDAPDDGGARAGELAALGETIRKMGDPRRAVPIAESAHRAYAEAYGDAHPFTINALNLLATAYQQTGDLERAETTYRRAIELGESTLGAKSPRLFDVRGNLASMYSFMGRLDESLALQTEVVADWKASDGKRNDNLVSAISNLASINGMSGNLARAHELQAEAVELAREIAGPDSILYAQQLVIDAGLQLDSDPARALADATQGLAVLEKHLGPEALQRLNAEMIAAIALAEVGRCKDALPQLERVATEIREQLGPDHPVNVGPRATLGRCRVESGLVDDGLADLQEARRINDAVLAPDKKILTWLEKAYRAKGDTPRAEAVERDLEAQELQNTGD
jgi:tetratricopeptide (TPR) repeat protein